MHVYAYPPVADIGNVQRTPSLCAFVCVCVCVAWYRINNSVFEKVVVTNTIPFQGQSDKIEHLSTAALLAEAIVR